MSATIVVHKDSHLDHALTSAQLSWLLNNAEARPGPQTLRLPHELGGVPCALIGPATAHAPVADAETCAQVRGKRPYASRVFTADAARARRLFDLPYVHEVTIIVGEHDGHPLVLFTAFGGPLAPREVGDPASDEASRTFWAQHALLLDGGAS